MEITYTKCGDYYLPDLAVPEEEPPIYGHFGRMRLTYLKEHRRGIYTSLLTSEQLTHHHNKINQETNEKLDMLIKQMVQAQGITEQLKADNQIAWVGAMNNIRIAAEEIVYQELIGL